MMDLQLITGIDIGATNTAMGLVTPAGEIVARESIPTRGYASLDDYIEAIAQSIAAMLARTPGKLAGIGVGAPAANYITGCVEPSANMPWDGEVNLAFIISHRMGGVKVKITNDANAAAVGEMAFGAARGLQDFIMITLGTGVGSGVVAGGALITGHDGMAGELGHIVVDHHNGRPCGCGRRGCLETYCSATGVVRTARQFLAERADEPSLLREIDVEALTARDIARAAEAGDVIARDVFTHAGTVLGEALADFAAFTSPRAFVLFGGLVGAGDLLLNPVRKAFEENLLFLYRDKISIITSELPAADAAILGAAALITL